MMRILPALCGVSFGVLGREIGVTSDNAKSDMDCLPDQREIQGEGGAFARAALHADIARVFLDDAVGDRKSKTGSAILSLLGRRLGSEKWIVDALNVLLRHARARARDAYAEELPDARR